MHAPHARRVDAEHRVWTTALHSSRSLIGRAPEDAARGWSAAVEPRRTRHRRRPGLDWSDPALHVGAHRGPLVVFSWATRARPAASASTTLRAAPAGAWSWRALEVMEIDDRAVLAASTSSDRGGRALHGLGLAASASRTADVPAGCSLSLEAVPTKFGCGAGGAHDVHDGDGYEEYEGYPNVGQKAARWESAATRGCATTTRRRARARASARTAAGVECLRASCARCSASDAALPGGRHGRRGRRRSSRSCRLKVEARARGVCVVECPIPRTRV